MGEARNDISSYRAYNSVGINMLQKCLVVYYDDRSKQQMEDPCSGDVYRVWDGLAIFGYASSGNITGSPNALARLRLGVDGDGYIVAFKGDNSIAGDGVPGHGRITSSRDVLEGSKAMLDAIRMYSGIRIDIPMQDGYMPIRADMQWRWIDGSMKNEQRVDYIKVDYIGMSGISGYTLSVFDLERYPMLRLEQEQESSALAIYRMLDYNYEQDPQLCKYGRQSGSIDNMYYTLVSRWHMRGDSSCSPSHTMFVWRLDDGNRDDGVRGSI